MLASWGPGRFDAELLLDGKAFKPDGRTAATLLPAAFGLAGVNLHTYTGWGSVPYWNAFVAIIPDARQGNVLRPAAGRREQVPARRGQRQGTSPRDPDLVTSQLPDLHVYQVSIPVPTPTAGASSPLRRARPGDVQR